MLESQKRGGITITGNKISVNIFVSLDTIGDEEGPVKPMPILWYEEMFAERPRLFCGPMTYQKCAHRMGRKKEARREK